MPIPPALVQVLGGHKERTRGIENPLGLVFPSIGGCLVHPSHLSKRNFDRVATKAGAQEGFRLYDMRHTCATLMLANGAHPRIVAERLGHSTTQLTLDTYSHVTPTMQDVATEQLADVVYGSPGDLELRPIN